MLSVASVALPCFPYYLINGVLFWRKDLNKKCVFLFSLQLFSERLLIRRRIKWHTVINYIGLHVKFPLLLSDLNENWILSTSFRKASNSKFHENSSSESRVVPCGRKHGRTGRQPGLTKLIVVSRNFANAPKIALEHFESLWISYSGRLYAQTHCLGVTWKLRREQKKIIFSVRLFFWL